MVVPSHFVLHSTNVNGTSEAATGVVFKFDEVTSTGSTRMVQPWTSPTLQPCVSGPR